ncbi:hypothetical protein [uncultured Alistipes sp.]|uniref:DUF6712 family protein n=1 Tax=uncultured Alistipes sp. TaxID=538949 RepID=UPI00266FD9C4|nr:hypothetical protein [uncultured Alistipes sp.]
MAEVALISEELFRENSPVKEDTIITKFTPFIMIAQKLHIARILGGPLTEELQEAIKADDLTPEQSALIRVIAPALSFWAVYQALPFHWAAIVNKGVTLRESENSRALGIDDVAQVRRWLADDAQALTRDLEAYLERCRDAFPSWRPPTPCGCGPQTPHNDYDHGIHIPRR